MRVRFRQNYLARPLFQFEQVELDRAMIEQIRARIAGLDISLRDSPGAQHSMPATSPPQLGILACAVAALFSMFTVMLLRFC